MKKNTNSTHITSELSRDLSSFHITMMGLGMMVGAGVFLGIGNSVNIAGPGGALLTFAFNGVIALFTALSYAETQFGHSLCGRRVQFYKTCIRKGNKFYCRLDGMVRLQYSRKSLCDNICNLYCTAISRD